MASPGLRSRPVRVYQSHRQFAQTGASSALAIGNFDGVHVGHKEVARQAVAIARAEGGEAVALTFAPHPAQVLARGEVPRLLTTQERKLELLAEAGFDACVVEPFTRETAQTSADDFARHVLADALRAKHIIIGRDFCFGKDRQGNAASLTRLGHEFGFAVTAVAPVSVNDAAGTETASSSRIRALLSEGEIQRANRLLGRHFDVDGTVVHGAHRGKGLGFPTANIEWRGETIPALGIYAVLATDRTTGEPLRGAASIGQNPTFGPGPTTLEVYVFDFSGDLYGHQIRVSFVERLRAEVRFDSVDALIAQMNRDVAEARKILPERP